MENVKVYVPLTENDVEIVLKDLIKNRINEVCWTMRAETGEDIEIIFIREE